MSPPAHPTVQHEPSRAPLELSVVIPCLNEAQAIGIVVAKAREAMARCRVRGEVIVVDNGSTDATAAIAEEAGARVVGEPRRGYGSAYLAGFSAAGGEFIVMGDGDDTYDFGEIGRFLEPLRHGADMVIGNRMAGLEPGSMPWLHRYVGNPLLTGTLNLFFKTGIKDAHCGMRSFRRDLLPALELTTTGMEFASEQVIRASRLGLDIRELDIGYHPRKGEAHLSSFSDGWRHLRFLLVHSPTWLFVVPATLMLAAGMLGFLVVLTGVHVFGRQWEMHTLIASATLCILGAQVLQLGAFGRAYAFFYLGEPDELFDAGRRRLRLEHGLLLGGTLLLAGLVIAATVLIQWVERGLGSLGEERLALIGLTLMVLGVQVIFGAFFLSILGLRGRRHVAAIRPQPVEGKGAEPHLEAQREPAVASSELQPAELDRLIDDGVRDPPQLSRAPQPGQLPPTVTEGVASQGAPRGPRSGEIRPFGRGAGIEEALERRAQRVGVGVANDRLGLVDQPVAGQ